MERRAEGAKGGAPRSGLGELLATGVPDREPFVRAMLAEFPEQRTAAEWAAEWEKAKEIEANRGKPDR